MSKGVESHRQPAEDEDGDFCLADTLVNMSDAEIEQMAEEDARADVTSSAYEGIPLDKAALRIGLIESYKKLRAEWPIQRSERMTEQRMVAGRQ